MRQNISVIFAINMAIVPDEWFDMFMYLYNDHVKRVLTDNFTSRYSYYFDMYYGELVKVSVHYGLKISLEFCTNKYNTPDRLSKIRELVIRLYHEQKTTVKLLIERYEQSNFKNALFAKRYNDEYAIIKYTTPLLLIEFHNSEYLHDHSLFMSKDYDFFRHVFEELNLLYMPYHRRKIVVVAYHMDNPHTGKSW